MIEVTGPAVNDLAAWWQFLEINTVAGAVRIIDKHLICAGIQRRMACCRNFGRQQLVHTPCVVEVRLLRAGTGIKNPAGNAFNICVNVYFHERYIAGDVRRTSFHTSLSILLPATIHNALSCTNTLAA